MLLIGICLTINVTIIIFVLHFIHKTIGLVYDELTNIESVLRDIEIEIKKNRYLK
jgi:hypothetical protein